MISRIVTHLHILCVRPEASHSPQNSIRDNIWNVGMTVKKLNRGEEDHQGNLPDNFFHNLINFINSFVQDCRSWANS